MIDKKTALEYAKALYEYQEFTQEDLREYCKCEAGKISECAYVIRKNVNVVSSDEKQKLIDMLETQKQAIAAEKTEIATLEK